MPLRWIVCSAASSRIAGGIAVRVGGSFTGVTVSTNVSLMLTTVLPIVFVTVTVIVVVPTWSRAGVTVSVRTDVPTVPVMLRLAGAFGTSVGLLDVAAIDV